MDLCDAVRKLIEREVNRVAPFDWMYSFNSWHPELHINRRVCQLLQWCSLGGVRKKANMVLLFIFAVASFLPCVYGGNYTVTHEVWFDVEIRDYDGPGDDYRGRIVIGLFGDTVPMTVLNFASIANGYERKVGGRKKKLNFKGTPFHRIVPDFIIQGGDTTTGDGTGGEAIFAPKFVDENFILSHKAAGYVSMANHGPDTNGSQFFIMLNKARWLDKKHVVFGKVVKGMDTVRIIASVETDEFSTPKKRIKIIDSGSDDVKKYTLTEEETLSDEDIEK